MTSLAISENPPRQPSILGALATAYVALLPYQFMVGRGLNFAPADCALLLVLVLAAGQLKFRKQLWTVWHVAIGFTFILGSFVAATRFGKLEQYEVLNKSAGLLLPFLSYAAITSCISEWSDIRRLLRVFVISTGIQNAIAVAAFLAAYLFGITNPFVRYGGSRLSGMLIDPNAYGGLLVAALVIVEGASWGATPLFRSATLWSLRFTLALGILFTFSRSAWVALGLALLLLCMVRFWVAGRFVVAALVSAPCILLVMGARFVPFFEVMASRPKQVQGRFDLIDDALNAFARHPWLGGGIGSFRLSEGEIAHNSAMWFLADFGIAGLLVLLGFLGWFFMKGWFAYRFAPAREQPVALALLLAHTAMFGLAMGIEAFYQRHWWLVFSLVASAYGLALGRMRQTPRGL